MQAAGAVVQTGDMAGGRRRGGGSNGYAAAVGPDAVGSCKRKFFEQPGGGSWPETTPGPSDAKRPYGVGGGGGAAAAAVLHLREERHDGDEDEGEEEVDAANTFMVSVPFVARMQHSELQ